MAIVEPQPAKKSYTSWPTAIDESGTTGQRRRDLRAEAASGRHGRASIEHDQLPPVLPHFIALLAASRQLPQLPPYSIMVKSAQLTTALASAALRLAWPVLEP
jgi:hypothetical protein